MHVAALCNCCERVTMACIAFASASQVVDSSVLLLPASVLLQPASVLLPAERAEFDDTAHSRSEFSR